jgi:hypothetical protein
VDALSLLFAEKMTRIGLLEGDSTTLHYFKRQHFEIELTTLNGLLMPTEGPISGSEKKHWLTHLLCHGH